MIRFCTKTELHRNKHLGCYIAFGIRAYHKHRLLAYIPDVFCHRRQAREFVRICNAGQPELIHLKELIEDVL